MAISEAAVRRIRGPAAQAGRWIGAPLGTILAATVVVYLALGLALGDPARAVLGAKASAEQVEALRHQMGFDQPLPFRFWHWLTSAVTGDFGTSLTYRGQSVLSLLEPRVGITLWLVAYAAVLFVVTGVGIGVLGGAFRRLGPPVAVVSGVGIGLPAFVACQLFIAVFAVRLGWFPSQGAGGGGADRLYHLTLPAVTLSISYSAFLAQVTRTAVVEQRNKAHVETATGRGLPARWVFRRHVLRNASIPIATVTALSIAGLFAAAVVVESAFGLGGLGSLLVQSVSAKDYNVVLAISVILVVAFVVATTVIDAVGVWLDPRLRGRRSN